MGKFAQYVSLADGYVWGVLLYVLLGSHVLLTFMTKFMQRYVFRGIKLSMQDEDTDKGISIFGSLMTALSATIGTGNIVSVGTAIFTGGPGAVFWMWIAGIFGIATKYAESYIAVKHRRLKEDGAYVGGAMTVFERKNLMPLAYLFAILAALAAFGIGCATQASAIVDLLRINYSIPTYASGLALCILTALVVFGGLKSIARTCERLVPIMSIIYCVGCAVILIINGPYLGEALKLIVVSAFSPRAALGGFVGSTINSAMRRGVERGLFSNEAGMGSAPIATAAGKAKNAVKPALVGSTGVFWDTVVVCLMTGLVIVSSVIGNDAIDCLNIESGSALVNACFGQIPIFGTPLLVFGILTFAYSTILGWSYYGESAVEYLLGNKAIKYYRMLWIIVIFVGSTMNLSVVWQIADIMNGLMCIPNIVAIFLCRKELYADTAHYLFDDHLDELDTSIE